MVSTDYDNVKSEKAKALHRFHSIGFLFRITEICVALLLLCWIFTSLPFAFQISVVFLRRITSVVSTPLFMFLLGNSIVVALLTTKSAVFSAASTIDGGTETDIYDAFIRTGENRVVSSDVGDLTEEIIDDKQIIETETDSNSNPTVAREDNAAVEPEKNSVSVTDSTEDHPVTRVYRRSKSEISAKQCPVTVAKPLLRRSETEKCRETVESCGEVPFPEDGLTNEEFQKTIEAFIAKQLIFRRRESLAVVIHKDHNQQTNFC
ncbi:Uncharacterized protein Rs2_05232 [Raphanus sativus]|uniref:Uncharacterized protein LOC108840561 n=1 Tax=Raphanus sativus TaxID=3726 RepID=A0A6J0MBH1_RAPSA|nr:uncharacterized protein LOC108840561 [Raphanus sativus]KAJ4910611.1 Uncharacterized protein Rs2_05232 [Raphanus sativus]